VKVIKDLEKNDFEINLDTNEISLDMSEKIKPDMNEISIDMNEIEKEPLLNNEDPIQIINDEVNIILLEEEQNPDLEKELAMILILPHVEFIGQILFLSKKTFSYGVTFILNNIPRFPNQIRNMISVIIHNDPQEIRNIFDHLKTVRTNISVIIGLTSATKYALSFLKAFFPEIRGVANGFKVASDVMIPISIALQILSWVVDGKAIKKTNDHIDNIHKLLHEAIDSQMENNLYPLEGTIDAIMFAYSRKDTKLKRRAVNCVPIIGDIIINNIAIGLIWNKWIRKDTPGMERMRMAEVLVLNAGLNDCFARRAIMDLTGITEEELNRVGPVFYFDELFDKLKMF